MTKDVSNKVKKMVADHLGVDEKQRLLTKQILLMIWAQIV